MFPTVLGSPRWIVCLLAGLGAAATQAAIPTQNLGREQGLPSAQVHAVAQDPSGIIWFAGPLGLTRYDGARMTDKGPADGLSTQGLRSLTLGPDGKLWIGTDVGVDLLDRDGTFRPLSDPASWGFGFVEDIGIASQYQDKVFGLFERLDQSIEGTGVGLTLVKRIVEVHGGRIWVESEGLGHGSTFSFTLPREKA